MGRQKEKPKGGRWRESGTKTDNVSDNAKPSFVFLNGETVGVDGISVEILKSVPWRALQKIEKVFEIRYFGQNKEDIKAWLRNLIVQIPKKMDRLEGQTRGICVQSFLAKWYCGCFTILLHIEMRSV